MPTCRFSPALLIALLLTTANVPITAIAKPNSPGDKPVTVAAPEGNSEKAPPTEAAESEPVKSKKVRLALLKLNGELPETLDSGSPFTANRTDLRKFIGRVEQASKDDKVAGLVLEFDGGLLSSAQVTEIRGAVERFRKSGKKVTAVGHTFMPNDYLLAAACDEIVMPGEGMLYLPGVRIEATFYRDLLSILGIQADFIHMGDAKGAAEPYTRRSFSEPVRANITALVDDLYDYMLVTIATDRGLTTDKAREAVDHGLLTAAKARELGLIDRVEYADELRATLATKHGADELVYVEGYGQQKADTDFSGPAGLLKLMSALSGGGKKSTEKGKKIAIVYAVGPIMTGESQSSPFGSAVLGSTTIVDALTEANDDNDVAAIVLRINSPGGSAIASDLMWRRIETLDKPIVASMGDVAASGGYYIAMGCDRILAEPNTITGSIGVVGGKLTLGNMLSRLGVSVEVIARGANSGIFSTHQKFSPSERESLLALMEDTYDQFTRKAAQGRKLELERLRELAGGKVYTGRQAKRNGLIDDLGTLHDAVASAKQLAGLGEDDEVRIITLPKEKDFFELVFGSEPAEREVRSPAIDLGSFSPEVAALLRKAEAWQHSFREPIMLLMPWELSVR